MNAMNRLHELKEKAKREGLTEEEKAELQRAIHQWGLEGEFAMLEKQVRMLVRLAGRSPVVRGILTSDIVEALEPGAEYVLIERQEMNVLLETMELQVFLVKGRLQTLCGPGEPPLEKPGS